MKIFTYLKVAHVALTSGRLTTTLTPFAMHGRPQHYHAEGKRRSNCKRMRQMCVCISMTRIPPAAVYLYSTGTIRIWISVQPYGLVHDYCGTGTGVPILKYAIASRVHYIPLLQTMRPRFVARGRFTGSERLTLRVGISAHLQVGYSCSYSYHMCCIFHHVYLTKC